MLNTFSPSIHRQQRSSRSARGAGWHKKGYRNKGYMWINVRRGSYSPTRGTDVNEYATIEEFWLDTVRGIMMEDGFPLPEGWTFQLTSNKRVIEPSDELISTIFDGGENVYVKIYDTDNLERVYDFGTNCWKYHVPGQRR
ncbi:hypothetical protein BDZ94DRAFT_1171479 [Collybia nuda]|uniref:Uncharacterized protein n=1 Tax=Collybia nuda TaxID=64659 RepID=A0A9P5XYP4_9AGAR|nr:hypothetical protein BDZ94DRAFT_1171479 [Collybia nuda]